MDKKGIASIVLSALLASGSALVMTGCEEGPGERIGEKIDGKDNAADDKLTPDGRGETAGKKADRAVDDATD